MSLLFMTGTSIAQTVMLRPAPNAINIDGYAGEWGDKLIDIHNKAFYGIANDKVNLYLVVKTKDEVLQGNILGAGITFSVNIAGSKSITFPINDQKDARVYLHLDTLQTQIKTELTKYKKISLTGFTNINDELLSTVNPYGIKIAIGYDANGYLVYEEAIPLVLFNKNDLYSNQGSFTLKINNLKNEIKSYWFCETVGFFGNKDPSAGDLTELERGHDMFVSGIFMASTKALAKIIADSKNWKPIVRIENFTSSTEVSGKFTLAKIKS